MNRKPRVPLSDVSLRRLCRLYGYLEYLNQIGSHTITSSSIADALHTSGASVRKDIAHLGSIGPSPAGYPIKGLQRLLESGLNLAERHRACVVGLNWLGRGLLEAEKTELGGYEIAAGFDSSINRLELTNASVELYPIFEIEEVAPRLEIDFALVADAGSHPDVTSDRLCRAGIRGIVNFTPYPLGLGCDGITTIDVEMVDQLRRLAVLTAKKDSGG